MAGIRLVVVVFCVLVLGGCGRDGGEVAGTEPGAAKIEELEAEEAQGFRERGREVAGELVMNLGTQLKASLEAGGPEAALVVCQQMAQPITVATGRAHPAVRVRRTTLRWRNPANAPDGVDRLVLEEMERRTGEGGGAVAPDELDRVVRAEDGVVRYYRPLLLQALCVQCHGPEEGLAAGLVTVLDELYPEDQAVGYAEGDLRGVVVVEWELTPPEGGQARD